MANKKLYVFLIVFTVIFSYLSWLSVNRAINVPASSIWLVPMIYFSLYFIFLCLDIILIRNINYIAIIFAASLLTNLIFAIDIIRIPVMVLSLIAAYIAIVGIKKELADNVKVKIPKSLGQGKRWIIVALALVVASQYYSEIRNSGARTGVPRFEISRAVGFMTPRIISLVNPPYDGVRIDDLTADQLIQKLAEHDLKNISDDLELSNKRNSIYELEMGRLGDIAGREIGADEKVVNIFSEAVNRKVDLYFDPSLSKKSSAFPASLAALLFLTVLSVGTFMSFFMLHIANLLFLLLVRMKLVVINKIPTEIETIEA